MVFLGKKENIDSIVEMQMAMAMESEGLELKKSVLKKGVAEVIRLSYLGHYYLAYEAGNTEDGPIACMMVTEEWSDWNNAMYYWLQSVYVKPEYREQGVFTQMVSWLENSVAFSDVKSLRLYVDKNNDTAKKCYKKLGLKPCHYSMYEKVLKKHAGTYIKHP